jgi:hypothetical protein
MNTRQPQRRPRPKGTPARPPQRRSQPKGAPAPPQGTAGARRSLENVSAMPIAFLQQLPRWLAPSVLAGLFVVGAFVRGWIGAVAIFLVALFIGWLASLSWPRLNPPGRLLRVIIVALLLAFALWQGSR